VCAQVVSLGATTGPCPGARDFNFFPIPSCKHTSTSIRHRS
jgi:hypothetical protein